MSEISVVRTENIKHEAWIQFSHANSAAFEIRENTNFVDGIGGVTWVRGFSAYYKYLSN
jgi:hypothetical protein